MNLQQAMSHVVQAFPELENRRAESSTWHRSGEPIFDEHDFARFIAKEMAQGKNRRVQVAFDRMEELLCSGVTEVRDWVCAFVEAVQDVAGWKETGEEGLVRFLGPETRRAWTALDAIRADLAECSILEAEVTMWRAVHHTARGASQVG
ncbi:MAG TPA: hypothetical protein VNY29_15855 [Terriglobales bacterium]|jgi:hypothetical protein|nr:hypothetical protein [Terriglobales bacterium]